MGTAVDFPCFTYRPHPPPPPPPCPQYPDAQNPSRNDPKKILQLLTLAVYPALSERLCLAMKACLGIAFSGRRPSARIFTYPSLVLDPGGIPPMQLPCSHCDPLCPVHTFLVCSCSALPLAVFILGPFCRWTGHWVMAYSHLSFPSLLCQLRLCGASHWQPHVAHA